MEEEIEREVRFAVVIYGGVSLAVYINGAVQEMLSMVRATKLPSDKLSPLEQVYRKLGCIVRQQKPADPGSDDSADDAIWLDGTIRDGKAYPSSDVVHTRFVVDVLSGTSAGGINAIYLAKALANNQDLTQLAEMWLNVADIKRLLNDGKSAEYPVPAQTPPQSLLNSRWMYLKLLEALDGMDKAGTGEEPLVEHLDLYSTTTDLDGVPLPMALADQQVLEFRHRNVFHFQKPRADDNDDFGTSMNPFLAFAARCTSAFPFAFEPMALCDIFDIIRKQPLHKKQSYCSANKNYWERFYKDYVDALDTGESTPFQYRSFGDGGYLDNKPFSYAIETVMKRHADLPVDRKLIYVEPNPEDIGRALKSRKDGSDRPNPVENSLAALIELPRYETIRQDLERVLEWNRNVIRIKRMIRQLGESSSGRNVREGVDANFRNSTAFQFYLRLRRSAVTDNMAARVAEALGLDPSSARGEAIRGLAGQWRYRHLNREELLETYDLDYLSRAIQYLRARIRAEMGQQQPEGGGSERDALLEGWCNKVAEARRRLTALENKPLPPLTSASETADDVLKRKQDLEFAASPVAAAERAGQPGSGIGPDLLGSTPAAYRLRVRYLLDHGWNHAISAAHQELTNFFKNDLAHIRELLGSAMKGYGDWDTFDFQDSLVYPLTFGTNLGEVDPIDVFRISPADATKIAGVGDPASVPAPALMGQKLSAFGAFLDRRWRLHDMLLGRLHAAERLITAIVSDCHDEAVTLREALIKEAQEQIAFDWAKRYGNMVDQEYEEYAAVKPR